MGAPETLLTPQQDIFQLILIPLHYVHRISNPFLRYTYVLGCIVLHPLRGITILFVLPYSIFLYALHTF